ncbi:MAG TPA: hypothetical protein VG826_36185 [Pirellulales bacterium]|nr:hypothetical protein [Pirellulales bacterium]
MAKGLRAENGTRAGDEELIRALAGGTARDAAEQAGIGNDRPAAGWRRPTFEAASGAWPADRYRSGPTGQGEPNDHRQGGRPDGESTWKPAGQAQKAEARQAR